MGLRDRLFGNGSEFEEDYGYEGDNYSSGGRDEEEEPGDSYYDETEEYEETDDSDDIVEFPEINREDYLDKEFVKQRNQALCKMNTGRNDDFKDSVSVIERKAAFLRVMGITRFWGKDEDLDSNTLMADILSGIQDKGIGFIFAVKGCGDDIEVYLGVEKSHLESLKSTLVSMFPAIELREIDDIDGQDAWETIVPYDLTSGGIVCGKPTNKMAAEGRDQRLQMDQLIRGLIGRNFLYVVVAMALGSDKVVKLHDRLLEEMSVTFEHIKENYSRAGAGTGIEKQSYNHARYMENLEKMEKSYNDGISRGMWNVTAYFGTYGEGRGNHNAVSVGNLIRAVFSGEESIPERMNVSMFDDLRRLKQLLTIMVIPGTLTNDYRNHPLEKYAAYRYATLLNSNELAVLTALPGKEYPGYYIDDYVEFDQANRVKDQLKDPVKIGSIRRAGRGQIADENDENINPYFIEKNDYTRHCLIIGITGGGKTNTSKSLLRTLWRDSKIPFLVIESAKREYWELKKIKGFEALVVYTLGSDDDRTSVKYRLNPFETFPGISLQTHIDYVLSTFKAAFDLFPPLPYVLETSVYEIYEDRGWNIVTSENDLGLTLYPTMEDLYDKVGYVVDGMGYYEEVSSNIKSALEARIHSLMIGGKGAMLNTPKSVPIGELLSTPTVLELEDIGDDETKSFVIGVLMTQLYEYRKANMGQQGGAKDLKHILMIEEAHRLLKNVTASGDGNSTQAKSVEFFCNMLAEIRTYGQGIFIADQVPTKLAPDTLKNTNLKIVHRTVALEDREFVGNAMNMTPEQINYLSSLRRGYAAVYAEGDNSPKYVKLPYVQDDPDRKNMTRSQVIAQVQNSEIVRKTSVFSDFQPKHCGCTYCEMAHRCRHYQEIKSRIPSEKYLERILACYVDYKFDPRMLRCIFQIDCLKMYTFDVWERNCFQGIILDMFPDMSNGQKKKILSELMKLEIQTQKRK
ncbi:MAG: DUF87 domain-containing protein [Lachnospiraceae bacterium]|nr:DUF87 domain-containing protein [Lachnospiraceae bacterium]